MSKKVRVRFAPSPTGGLHLGGVRTVLFNYLFARQHGGDFILRIEDTDQSRFVAGAEAYIIETLTWCGMSPDEGPHIGGPYGPYRQSERKDNYRQYAEHLIQQGHAYYAFDTTAELEEMRSRFKSADNPSPQYNASTRIKMRNSFTLTKEEVDGLISDQVPYVIRIKMPMDEELAFSDMIRGAVHFNTSLVDDKVLLKADGMPTYHLAVVVDDYLMKITHAFRGEEWLPSAPVHLLLWRYLFGEDHMPQWAHLPLILKPDGNGKLSKRDGDRLGFPVFAMDWKDPGSDELTTGFKERGFLPEAFVNMLALLGWNDGTGQELFSLDELVKRFSIERVHKGGAKFDFEKAKWFNHEWIKKLPVEQYADLVQTIFETNGIQVNNRVQFEKILNLVKDRCTLLSDFYEQASFFYHYPAQIDTASILPKWNDSKKVFFAELIRTFQLTPYWEQDHLEKEFKEIAAASQLKSGELMLPLRIMLVGAKFGPGVFDIAATLGKAETLSRMQIALGMLEG